MKGSKKKTILLLFTVFIVIAFFKIDAYAAPNSVNIPEVNVSIGDGNNTPQDYVSSIKILIFFTILSLMPSIMIMLTSFTRIVVVFSFLRNALGITQWLPTQVTTGLAIFLTLFIMHPVYTDINNNAIQPYLQEQITQEEAVERGSKPLKEFMLKQTREKDLKLFVEISGLNENEVTRDNIPFTTLIPAFAISELTTAFEIGFLIYLPFIIMDMVIGSILMSMGMMMLPPAMVSLPFKILLFVMVDGWYLLIKSLVISFT